MGFRTCCSFCCHMTKIIHDIFGRDRKALLKRGNHGRSNFGIRRPLGKSHGTKRSLGNGWRPLSRSGLFIHPFSDVSWLHCDLWDVHHILSSSLSFWLPGSRGSPGFSLLPHFSCPSCSCSIGAPVLGPLIFH